MKAMIVEIMNNVAAVLSDDGCIVKIKNNNYEIGQVIQMSNPKIRITKKIVAFATSAAALVMLSVGTWAYASPYTYVSLDVNPSIEFTLNRFDRVLSVKAVNDDGEEILKDINLDDLKNSTIQDAITKTVADISEQGYFDGDVEGGIVITTSSDDQEKADDLAGNLQDTVENEVAENGNDVEVEATSVGEERVAQARELGVTPGKLNLVEKLQSAAGDAATIDINEWLNKPVKDIMKATKDFRKATAVSGSAITVEEKGNSSKANGNSSKAEDKTGKNNDKAQTKADNAQAKAQAAQAKTLEKAKEIELKAAEKAKEAQQKATEKAKTAQATPTVKAKKEAAQAKKDAEKAKAAQQKAAEKVKKAEKAAIETADQDETDTVAVTTNEDTNNSDKANGNAGNNGNSSGNGNGNSSNSNKGNGKH